jgi:hypothetical protein
MTSFVVETRIAHPLDRVFQAYRDELAQLTPFIPNVRSIEVLERKEEAGRVHLLNRWRAHAQVPGPLKSIVTEDKLGWLDRAVWDDARKQCGWSLEITALKDAVTCQGETFFHAEGTQTRMVIRGELQVDASRTGLPVPRFLAGGLGKAIETFAVALIKPNQEAVGRAVGKYLEQKSAPG